MEDIIAVFGDSLEQQRVYQQAQEQIHKILHTDTQTPSPNGEPHRRYLLIILKCYMKTCAHIFRHIYLYLRIVS